MRKPQVTIGFSTKSWSNNLDDWRGTPMTLETSMTLCVVFGAIPHGRDLLIAPSRGSD